MDQAFPPRTPNSSGIACLPKVRAVAKIWSSSEADLTASSIKVSLIKPKGEDSRCVALNFGDLSSSSYELDFCYEEHHDNLAVFEGEIQSLIKHVFDGHNASVIATGTTDDGKCRLIQDMHEERGLANLTAASMVELAERVGMKVSISMYESTADRVFDLFHPNQQEVLAVGDAIKNGNQKGFCQFTFASVPEFRKLLDSKFGKNKSIRNDPFRKSHFGFIFYVSTSGGQLVGKLNLVDLAGYENFRRKSVDTSSLPLTMKMNKSIHSVHHVLHSLSANETHVPYRETKLTHLLQDSLGGSSKILIINCLYRFACQDSMYMVSLASRSCRHLAKGVSSSSRKPMSSARAVFDSSKSTTCGGNSTNARKQNIPRTPSTKKSVCSTSALKARKLFMDTKKNRIDVVVPKMNLLEASSEEETTSPQEDINIGQSVDAQAIAEAVYDESHHSQEKHHSMEATPVKSSLGEEDSDKENNCNKLNEDASPPVSAKLRELSTSLKMLLNSTPSYANRIAQMNSRCHTQVPADVAEIGTPKNHYGSQKNTEQGSCSSPWQTLSESSARAKESLVEETLNFLNTATKDDLKKLKHIGEKRATCILQLRAESPQPFKQLNDLSALNLTSKQIKQMMMTKFHDFF